MTGGDERPTIEAGDGHAVPSEASPDAEAPTIPPVEGADGATTPASAAVATVVVLEAGAERSPRPEICPFLRRLDADGVLRAPVEAPDSANRCVATGDARPESSVQQESTCLRAAHASCPRYLRGTAPEPTALPSPPRREIPRATVAALLILLASASAAFTFVLVRGGISLPAAGLSPTGGPVALGSPAVPGGASAPTLAPSVAAPSTAPGTHVPPSAVATVPPTPTALATPTSPPTALPTPAPLPTPGASGPGGGTPSAARLGLLVACPGRPDCYIYTVRSGDNLVSIANYFGVPYARLLALNPWIADPAQIRKGDRLTLPTPTR